MFNAYNYEAFDAVKLQLRFICVDIHHFSKLIQEKT